MFWFLVEELALHKSLIIVPFGMANTALKYYRQTLIDYQNEVQHV